MYVNLKQMDDNTFDYSSRYFQNFNKVFLPHPFKNDISRSIPSFSKIGGTDLRSIACRLLTNRDMDLPCSVINEIQSTLLKHWPLLPNFKTYLFVTMKQALPKSVYSGRNGHPMSVENRDKSLMKTNWKSNNMSAGLILFT